MRENFLAIMFIAVVAHLVQGSSCLAADKVTCIVTPIALNVFIPKPKPTKEPNEQNPKESAEKKQIEPSPEFIQAVSQLFEEQLDKTNKFEVETRDPAKLAPGEKFKVARFLIVSEFSRFPIGEVETPIAMNIRVVKTPDSEIVAVTGEIRTAPVKVLVDWPKTLAELKEDAFKDSLAGKAVYSAIDQAVSELAGKADQLNSKKN